MVHRVLSCWFNIKATDSDCRTGPVSCSEEVRGGQCEKGSCGESVANPKSMQLQLCGVARRANEWVRKRTHDWKKTWPQKVEVRSLFSPTHTHLHARTHAHKEIQESKKGCAHIRMAIWRCILLGGVQWLQIRPAVAGCLLSEANRLACAAGRRCLPSNRKTKKRKQKKTKRKTPPNQQAGYPPLLLAIVLYRARNKHFGRLLWPANIDHLPFANLFAFQENIFIFNARSLDSAG